MPGKRFEDQVDAIRGALGERDAAASRTLLAKTLRGSNGHLIGLVADALGEDDGALLRLLPEAFARLLDDAIKLDPGCRGKVAIVRALDRCERREPDVFGPGVRHVQLEPVWGGRVDTAAELRGVCGMALVHMRAEQAMVAIAVLLADAEAKTRIAAARALAASGDRTVGEPLLRLRIAAGEPEPEVLGECFAALLELAGAAAIVDVAHYLRHADSATAEAAALALGGSRLPGAFDALRAADESLVGGDARRIRLLAIALVREPEAWAYLLGLVEHGAVPAAEDALRALATFHHDAELMAKLSEVVARRGEPAIDRVLEELLAGDGG